MRALHQILLLTAVCGAPWATLAQDNLGTELDLSTRAARRRYVLETAVAFADKLDQISSQRIAGGDLDQALKIKQHADLVRLGMQLPMEVSRVEGLAIDADLEEALSNFERARSLAIEACDAAKQTATQEGEVFLIQELTAERNGLRAETAADFHVWGTDPDAWEETRGGRVAHKIPQVFPLDSSRIPDELNARFGPRRFQISGRGRHDTFRYGRLRIGHIGKIGIIDRQLTEDDPVLQGVFRTEHSKIEGGTQHLAAFVQGNRAVDNAQFTPAVHQIYDWKAELKDGQIQFTMTDGSTTLVNRTVNATRLTRIGFAVSVRRPGQEASIYVAWK